MNGAVKLTMVGTGSAFGKKYHNNSCLVETDDYNLLIDCGGTVPLGLHDMGYDLANLNGVLITHIHGDHVNGLEELAWTMRYKYGKKIDLIGDLTMLYRLWENTLRGGLEEAEEGVLTLEDLFNIVPFRKMYMKGKESFKSDFYWTPIELAPSLKLDIIKTQHIQNKDSFSVFINNDIFYSGDVRFDPDLFEYLTKEREVGVIFHDCQLHDLAEVHAPLSKLLTLDEDLQRSIWLMHYGDNMMDFAGETGSMRFLAQGVTYTYHEDGRFSL
jgi:hydroxyacylglutathione hydrolase